MPKNRPRGTPGVLLSAFAAALVGAVCTAWEHQHAGAAAESLALLTGLGDHNYYPADAMEDFDRPVPGFPGGREGLFRRSAQPQHHDDSRMRRLDGEAGGRWSIYADRATEGNPPQAAVPLYYLKAADNAYIEFGERNHWPEYTPPNKQR